MSPYSGGQSDVVTKTGHKFAWARLNADTLLLALLAFGSGVFSVMDPLSDTTIEEVGFPTPGFYLRCGMYIIGGLMLLSALIRQHVPTEVIARTILTFAICYETFRYTQIFGFTDDLHWLRPAVLSLFMLSTSALRMSVLLSRKGLVVRLPERNATPKDES